MYKCKGVGLYTYSLSAPSNAEQASSRLVGGRGCRTALYPKPHKDEFLVELVTWDKIGKVVCKVLM